MIKPIIENFKFIVQSIAIGCKCTGRKQGGLISQAITVALRFVGEVAALGFYDIALLKFLGLHKIFVAELGILLVIQRLPI